MFNASFDNPTTYHRAARTLFAFWTTLTVAAVAGGVTLVATNYFTYGVSLAVAALFPLWPALEWADVLIGERNRPRTGTLTPLDTATKATVANAVWLISDLDDDERAALANAHRNHAHRRAYKNARDRAYLTADWAGRLWDVDSYQGAAALEAVESIAGGPDTVLAVLVADLAHPRDVLDLLGPWHVTGLPLIDAGVLNRGDAMIDDLVDDLVDDAPEQVTS